MITDYLHVFLFFTTWNLLLFIMHPISHRYVNLLYLAFITTMVGLYLSFVNPNRFVLRFGKTKYYFTGLEKFFLVDVTFHILVLVYAMYLYHVHYALPGWRETCGALLVLLLYVWSVNIVRVYGVQFKELAMVFAVFTLLFFSLF